MPLMKIKKRSKETLVLEQKLLARNYELTLYRDFCVGCEICVFVCPKEAIKHEMRSKTFDGKALRAIVDISLEKCNFCGICSILCPYGAIKVKINGKHILPIIENESFPELIREIHVDSSKCSADCSECEEACPLNLIKVSRLKPDENSAEDLNSPTTLEREWLKINVNVEKERCPTCRICEFKCPKGAIHVRKTFSGKIIIDQKKCINGCKDCLDICPITGALYVGNDGKVYANELYCTYCGACRVICPIDGAIKIIRTNIMHTPVKSGAWNKVLERITSIHELSKELKTRGSAKTIMVVERRFKCKEVLSLKNDQSN